jgi:hypothetical protein
MSGAQDAVTQGKPSALIRQSGGTPDGRMGIVACLSREDLFAQSIFEDFIEKPTALNWLVQIGHGVSHNQYHESTQLQVPLRCRR